MGQACCCEEEVDNDDEDRSFVHSRVHDIHLRVGAQQAEEDYSPLHDVQQQQGMTFSAASGAWSVGSGHQLKEQPVKQAESRHDPRRQDVGYHDPHRQDVKHEQPEDEFTVRVDRTSGQRLGVDVRHESASILVVKEVTSGGLFQQWNDSHPSAALKVGDRIVAVNGVRGNAVDMVAECEKNQMLEFAVQRPDQSGIAEESREFTVHLEKEKAQDLGIDIDDGNFTIVKVTGGLFGAWNDNHPDMAVLAGDQVVSVNGKREIKQMFAECTQKKKKVILDFVIQRDGAG